MGSPRFKFRTELMPDDSIVMALTAIPGVLFSNGVFTVGYNAAGLVEARLQAEDLEYSATPPKPATLAKNVELGANRVLQIPSLRPEVIRPDTGERVDIYSFMFPYQHEAIARASETGAMIARHGMGSGKSLVGVAFGLAQDVERTVIACRASNRLGYAKEINQYTVGVTYQVIEGQAKVELDGNARFLIVGWDTLPFHLAQILRLGGFNVVMDELHKVKNPKRYDKTVGDNGELKFTKKTNVVGCAFDLSRAALYRLGTTGTPMPNRPIDLWGQVDLIEPSAWGRRADFAEAYCDRHQTTWGGFDDSGKNSDRWDELKSRWDAITHDVPESVTHKYLPGLRFIPVYLGKDELCKAADLRKELKEAMKGEQSVRAGLMVAATQKRPVLIDKAAEYIAAGKKVAIFTARRKDAERIAAELAKRIYSKGFRRDAGLQGSVPIVLCHGGISTAGKRLELISPYIEAEGAAALVGTGQSLGESIDGLQCTHHVLLGMLPYTPGELEQWLGRFTRLGQKVKTLVEALIASGSPDERVIEILLDKLPAVLAVVGGSEKIDQITEGLSGRANAAAILDEQATLLGSIDLKEADV